MSMTISLISVAIAVGTTVSTASLAALCKEKGKSVSKVDTMFNDREILLKTLRNCGLEPVEDGADHIIVLMENGELHYERECEGAQYKFSALKVKNIDEIVNMVSEFENDYGRNVQAYTYHKIMESLDEHGLTLDSEEVLEDDSIVLTLNV